MGKLFTGPLVVAPRGSTGVKDASVSRALRSLEDAVAVILERMARAEVSVGETITGTSPIIVTGADVSLGNSGVTPGTYTNATVTVDAHGLVTAASSGSAGTDTLSIAGTALGNRLSTTTVNASTEGTVDWFVPVNAPGAGGMFLRSGSGTPNSHEKLEGPGWLASGAILVANGVSYSLLGPLAGLVKRTTNANDDVASNSLTTDTNYNGTGLTALNASGRGPGFRLTLPATNTQYVLRVYTEQAACTVTVKAQLIGRSVTPVSASFTTTGHPTPGGFVDDTFQRNQWTITYAAAGPATLEVDVLVTALDTPLFGNSAYVALAVATLST